MVVLSKFIYIFQNVPIFLRSSFFKTIDSIIIPFIWANKPPHISKSHLQKPTSEGGLGLPNFHHYYWACNARAWIFWTHVPARAKQVISSPTWPVIEYNNALSLTEASLPVILLSNLNVPQKKLKSDFVLRNSLKILKQNKGVLGLLGTSIYAPICHNPSFKPGLMDIVFSQWSNKGLSTIKDLYING